MSIRHHLSQSLLILAISALASETHAQEDPGKQLHSAIVEAIDLLHNSEADASPAEKRDEIVERFSSTFSFDLIIRRALGRNWNQLTGEQQGTLTDLITDLLINAYTGEIAGAEKPEVELLGTDELSSNKIEVLTKVSYRNTMASISYRLANVKDRGWQIYDVLVEGVSMVNNYRKQFDDHFRKGDAEGLISSLREKLAN